MGCSDTASNQGEFSPKVEEDRYGSELPPTQAATRDAPQTAVAAAASDRTATSVDLANLDMNNNDQLKEEQKAFCSLTAGEVYMYLVALCCGISMMMPINAIFSAPDYITNYYKYAMKDEFAVADHMNFWNNSMTYYNLISMVTSLVMEPLTLTRLFRRIPILPRLLAGLIILIVEIIILLVVPVGGTTEAGAIATICISGFIGGFGKSIFESTVYGMFGAFPPSYMSTMMGGVGISGVITSLIQIAVKGALGPGFDSVVIQSKIYYGVDVGIQGITFIMLLLLRFNSVAKNSFGDLGGGRSKVDAGDADLTHLAAAEATEEHADEAAARAGGGTGYSRERAADGAKYEVHDGAPESDLLQKGDPESPTGMVMRYPVNDDEGGASGDSSDNANRANDGPAEARQHGAVHQTSTELLLAAGIFPTLWKIIWMFIACGFNFLVTLMLFPTVVISADRNDYWYGTIAVFLFNVLDVLGRFTPSLKCMWPKTYKQRYIIVAASFGRAIFLPLLILYSYHYIPTHAYGYVMMILFGYTNGYIGSMALVLGPKSKGVIGDGQRFVAGTLMGISILVGGIIGTVLSICMQTVRGSQS